MNGIDTLTVVGILPPRTVPGNEDVLVTLTQAQAMTGQADQINTIDVALTSTDEAARNSTIAAIGSALGERLPGGCHPE